MRERRVLEALRTEIGRLDPDTRSAIGRALHDDRVKLSGGNWGDREDADGCVLSIAAWSMGLPDGEAPMHRTAGGGAIPALFDELWALLLMRLGDVELARASARRLVGDALGTVDVEPRMPAHV